MQIPTDFQKQILQSKYAYDENKIIKIDRGAPKPQQSIKIYHSKPDKHEST